MSAPEDYERTWLQRPKATVSPPAVGVAPAGEEGGNALATGTRIGEFEIVGLIGIGGFGIVYLAHDHSLGRNVALKEYMPSSLAARTQGLNVSVKSGNLAETFAIGLRSFVNEARLLAQFDHPSLVKVYRFWEANATAYMVMPFYEGITLKQALQQMRQAPSEDWLRGVIEPLLDALEIIHRENCFHRDIAPDNILLLRDGRPLLLDFGAARRVIGDRTQALTVILKQGYAPLEQYAETPKLHQGAWTDLYALAAVVYHAITGSPPAPSVGRLINDTMVPLTQAAAGRYSQSFLQAIDRCLAVMPEDRPQSTTDLRGLIALKDVSSTTPLALAAAEKPTAKEPSSDKIRTKVLVASTATAMLGIAVIAFYALRAPKPDIPPSQAAPNVVVATASSDVPPAAPPAASIPPLATGERTSTPPQQPQTADRQAAIENTVGGTVREREQAITPPPKVAGKSFDPVDMLREIYAQRDAGHLVEVVPEKARVKIDRDHLRFRVTSAKPGYLYVLMVGSDRKSFNLLFPNGIDASNRISENGQLSLPRRGWTMKAAGPPGTNHFVAMVSEHRRDFSTAGLKTVDPFAEFPLRVAEKILQESANSGRNPFSGTAVCSAGQDCSSRYGAALFSIEEVK